MKLDSVEAIVGALEGEGVRFIVAGGLAVNVHGLARFTKEAAGRPQDLVDLAQLRMLTEPGDDEATS